MVIKMADFGFSECSSTHSSNCYSPSLYRYGIMLDCWGSAADDRPSFSQLVAVLTTHLETLAGGYLKITLA